MFLSRDIDVTHAACAKFAFDAKAAVGGAGPKRLGYAYNNTTAVRVEVTEGTGKSRDEVEVVGEVILENLPARSKGSPLEVLYRYNVNQILEVYIIDVETGTRHHAQINLKGNIGGKKMADRKRQIAQMRVY